MRDSDTSCLRKDSNEKAKFSYADVRSRRKFTFEESIFINSPIHYVERRNSAIFCPSPSNNASPSKRMLLYANLIDMMKRLQSNIDKIMDRFKEVIEKQEKSYIISYKDEMNEISKQMEYYKNLFDENNIKKKNDIQMITYQKSIEWLRNESMRLNQELISYKDKISNHKKNN